jgi:hypothetical protein
MSAPPAQTLATHLLNQTLASIALLEQLSVITPSDAHAIRSKLPSPTGPFPSVNSQNTNVGMIDVYGQQSSRMVHVGMQEPQKSQAPPPGLPPRARPGQRAQALWDYSGAVSRSSIEEIALKVPIEGRDTMIDA